MRPESLNRLFEAVSCLAGVGPKQQKLFDKLVVPSSARRGAVVLDLLYHLPGAVIDRRRQTPIAEAPDHAIVTIKGRVTRHRFAASSRLPSRVFLADDSGEIALVYFHARRDWLEKALPLGTLRHVSGRIERFNGEPQIVHPDHVVAPEDFAGLPLLEPVYPATEGLSQRQIRSAILAALPRADGLPEWLDPALARQLALPSFAEALDAVHRPDDPAAIEPTSPARRRLAYDEVLAGQIALALVRARLRRRHSGALPIGDDLAKRVIAALPFGLTGAQQRTIAEIRADLAGDERMVRLVQGDVGAGKTVVALVAAAFAIERGGQAALMAPTELLARQHAATLQPIAAAAGIESAILTGRDKGENRREVIEAIYNGNSRLVIGTHALIQDEVRFANLGLAIIDEQHRFGVQQRLALGARHRDTDLLVMTATPIPRTLLLSHFGDMDISRLDEKPPGRRPIATRAIALDRMAEVVERLKSAITGGARVYWVCPLVEESEAIDLAAASSRAEMLEREVGPGVGLLHGRMKNGDKDTVMQRFSSGDIQLLVATTVVEVGVDVRAASIMVIEHAERFGLAQLHQLRGRVGRGEAASTCILLFKGPLSPTAHARLDILRQTEDGFRIAEEDLRLRGGGEILGTRQSGLEGFRFADTARMADILSTARDEARLILARDPALTGPRGAALRTLLYLQGRDETERLIAAG